MALVYRGLTTSPGEKFDNFSGGMAESIRGQALTPRSGMSPMWGGADCPLLRGMMRIADIVVWLINRTEGMLHHDTN
jgi:hypothetical protein